MALANQDTSWKYAADWDGDPIELYAAPTGLEDAFDAATVLEKPVLFTGEPGTGKTSAAAWWAARQQTRFYRYQVRSDASWQGLLYEFDNVEYFRTARVEEAGASAGVSNGAPPVPAYAAGSVLRATDTQSPDEAAHALEKFRAERTRRFIRKGQLWQAADSQVGAVLLLDEVDKAPVTFLEDLLDVLETRNFRVSDLSAPVEAPLRSEYIVKPAGKLWVVLTSNERHPLSAPVLRRCVHYQFSASDPAYVQDIVARRFPTARQHPELGPKLTNLFFALRKAADGRYETRVSELLDWWRVCETRGASTNAGPLPWLNLLVKTPEARQQIKTALEAQSKSTLREAWEALRPHLKSAPGAP